MFTGSPQDRIGPFRIERQVGAGGMGVVYVASRADQQFEQQVALKILRPEFASQEWVGRFRSERQILANLDHPYIARLLDGGTAEDGRPYLVMEFIEGQPLTEYCAQRNLSLAARLDLFRKICSAVQYAHEHLVIHRDLKPANILIGSDGQPKLLDFGVATLVERENAAVASETQPGTPAYASPEQLAGKPVTTASDIYTLGVLFYELLTDRVPAEPEPPYPSRFRKPLASDLDNIALMALQKEPERRYRSAAEFADDIWRYEHHRPVAARKDTVAYLVRKFVARNRAASAATLMVLAAMAALIGILGVQIRTANAQRLRAEEIGGVMHRMLAGAMRTATGPTGRDLKVVDVLSAAESGLDSELKDQPAERAALRATIGTTLSRLGLLGEADRDLRAALRTQESLFGQDAAPLAETLHDLGSNERYQGRLREAERDLRRSVAIYHRHSAPAENEAASDLAVTLFDEARFRDAAVLFEQVLKNYRSTHAAMDATLVTMMNNVAGVRFNSGDFAGAGSLQKEAVAAQRGLDRGKPPTVELGRDEVNLGVYLRLSGDPAAAEPAAIAAVDAFRERLGDAHWMTAYAELELARTYSDEGRHALAVEEARKALAILMKTLPPAHQEFAHAWLALGSVLTAAGKPSEAEPYLRKAFLRRQAAYPNGGLRLAQVADPLAVCLIAQNEFEQARPFANIAYAGFKASYGENNRITQAALARLNHLPDRLSKVGRP